MAKIRLINLVLNRGLSPDRDHARRIILAGNVLINGHRLSQPAAYVSSEVVITFEDAPRPVSRAGRKLEHALEEWTIPTDGVIAADIGAASGGFTECLLKRGAQRVYAIETGRGLLSWKLRQDPRVVVMEGTSILHLNHLPELLSLVTIDTSWTPLRRSLPCVVPLLKEEANVIALLKPNYEMQDRSILVDGVLQDSAVLMNIVGEFLDRASEQGWKVLAHMKSPMKGDKGNVEWLVHLKFN